MYGEIIYVAGIFGDLNLIVIFVGN